MASLAPTYAAVAVAFIASAILSKELARRRHRNEYIYFFMGLFLGPFAVIVALAPIPNEPKERIPDRQLKVIKGRECPECHREMLPRTYECGRCGSVIEPPWWDRQLDAGNILGR